MALITPKKVKFTGQGVMDRMWTYVGHQLDYLLGESQQFRTVTVPEWTRLLKGRPSSPTKNFPFPNASNLVVQLIATRTEQLLSRVMLMWGIDPLFNVTAMGDLIGQPADEQAKVLEQFLGDMAVDPEELNLYSKEEKMYHDGIAYGTAFLYLPWQYITEEQCTSISGEDTSLSREESFQTLIKKDGPSPENIPVYRMLVDNKVTDLDSARFVAREVPLTREAIEDRIAFGVWSKELGEKVLASPDKYGSSENQATTEEGKGLQNTGNPYEAIYLIYECFFKFLHNKRTYSIIAHYHKGTNSRLSAIFNHYPKNMLPIEDYRFGYDTDSYRGYGYIEMLEGYQQEVSTLHNNRLDNDTLRNSVAFRVNKDSELGQSLKIYPGVGIPADKDEVEILQLANGSLDNGQSEQFSISMTNERSGVDPAISGMGSGVVNNKRGIYSSQGTLAVLQQQNNRTGLRMMDVRNVHTRIGRKLIDMYAFLGVGKRLRRYGAQAEILAQALDSVKQNNLGLILKPTTASSNVESDRQNSILLSQIQDKYFATTQQLMQMLQQAQNDENQQKYIMDAMMAEQALTRHIFRVFGHSDVDKLVPFPEAIRNARQQQQQQQTASSPQPTQSIVPVFNGAGNGAIPIRA